MLLSIVSLIIIVILIVIINVYTRIRINRRREDDRLRLQIAVAESLNFTVDEELVKPGLDPSVIASLPTFSYKVAAGDSQPIGCSVCLEPVVEDSTVKELPNCKHLFHVECIDLWLRGGTNCPNCRAAVEVVVGGGEAQLSTPPTEQEVVGGGGGHVEKGGVSGSSGLDSFRRTFAVEDRSAMDERNSGGDEFACGEDLERQ
ncbi:E3 ubiquitin-protein ligase ATL41 [Linum grandiflorum]